jgi:hypothetical protein
LIRTELRLATDRRTATLASAALDILRGDIQLLNDARRLVPRSQQTSAGRQLMLESGDPRVACETAVIAALELLNTEQTAAPYNDKDSDGGQ